MATRSGGSARASMAPPSSSPSRSILIFLKASCASCPPARLEWFSLMTAAKILAVDDEPDIELLLLDINMPVMDGLTLLVHLRERRSPVRAIIVSAYGDMAKIRTAMNRGAFDFVTKPVDLNDLEITINKTLEEIAKLRELERRRAASERARTNLSRYFSPNLVEMLADRDEPLGAVRRQTVAVLFVDIVGFTRMAERMKPTMST